MPPITLTPQAWAKTAAARKAGASYKTYINYITAARRPKPVTMDSLLQTLTAGPTAAQQSAAKASINSQIAATVAANNAAARAGLVTQQNQANRAQGFALALGSLRKHEGDEALKNYSSAASQIQGLGTGLTGELRDVQQAQADKTKADIDLMTGGLGKAPSYDLDALHNELQYGHVTAPAANLAERAADAAIQARMMTDTSAANVGSIAQQYLAKKADAETALAAQNAAIRAQRPDLYQKALAAETDAQRQNIATYVAGMGLQNATQNTESLIGARGKTSGAAVTNAGTSRAKVTGVNPKSGAVLPGFWKNPRNGGKVEKIPTGYQVTANGSKLIPLPKTPSATSGTTNVKNVEQIMNNTRKQIGETVKSAAYASYNKYLEGIPGTSPYKPKLSYAEAQRRLLAAYVPAKFRTNPRVLQMVADALSSVGYVAPKPKSRPRPVAKAASGKPLP